MKIYGSFGRELPSIFIRVVWELRNSPPKILMFQPKNKTFTVKFKDITSDAEKKRQIMFFSRSRWQKIFSGGLITRGGVEDTRPRPRTQKKSEAKAKDSLSEDRHSRGQGQECSRARPRTKDTSASALQKKKKGLHKNFLSDLQKQKKKGLHKNFSSDLQKKNVFQKNFQALHKILTIQKIVLSSSRGQANFRGLEASRPRPRT